MKNFLEKYNCDITKDSVWVHTMPTQIARSTFFFVQETGLFKCRSKYFTERENQNSFYISYTLSGKGSLTYNDKNFTVSPGQAFFIDCMTIITIRQLQIKAGIHVGFILTVLTPSIITLSIRKTALLSSISKIRRNSQKIF